MKERRPSTIHRRRSYNGNMTNHNNGHETRFVKDDINNDELRELRKSLAGMKVATNFAAKYLIEMQGDATTTNPPKNSTNTSTYKSNNNHNNNNNNNNNNLYNMLQRSASLPGRRYESTTTTNNNNNNNNGTTVTGRNNPEESLRRAVRRISIKGNTTVSNSSQPTSSSSSSNRASLKESFVNMIQNSVRHIDVGINNGQKRTNSRRFTVPIRAATTTQQYNKQQHNSHETLPEIHENHSTELKSSTDLPQKTSSKPSNLDSSHSSQKFDESFQNTSSGSMAELQYFYEE